MYENIRIPWEASWDTESLDEVMKTLTVPGVIWPESTKRILQPET